MTSLNGYRPVDLDSSRASEVIHVDGFAFAFTTPAREADAVAAMIPWSRARGVEIADAVGGDVGALAAVHASFEFRTRVPGGGEVPTAGLTWVGVHPGHRRRGLLRVMIDDHFARSLGRGEVISTLYAAETQIYQRFGYGLASYDVTMKLGRGAELRDVPGADDLNVTIDSADADRHGEIVRSVQSRIQRPGAATHLTDESIRDMFLDLESERHGAEEMRIAIVRDGDDPVAYAVFRRRGKWEDSLPQGTVGVSAAAALTTPASHRLWSVLMDFDLMGVTHADRLAIDDPLMLLLKDIRAQKIGLRDNLWLRILDLPAALEQRGYAADCDVTIEVTDDQLPDNAGTWRIVIADGAASVRRTDGPGDVRLGVASLSAAYLGGMSLASQHRAGLIEERTPGAVPALSAAFLGDLVPVANFGF